MQDQTNPMLLLVLSDDGPIIPDTDIPKLALFFDNNPLHISTATSLETAPYVSIDFESTSKSNVLELFEYVIHDES